MRILTSGVFGALLLVAILLTPEHPASTVDAAPSQHVSTAPAEYGLL